LIQRAVARFEILQNPKPLVGNTVESNFMFEEYPKVKYHWTKKEVTVKDVNAELALGGGWADTPADFAPYRGPHVASVDQDAVTKWADDWRGDTLTPEVRRKIRAQLLRADAAFWEAPEKESADWAAMRLAFDGIAKVLFEAGILTGEDLESVIPTLVWDSAIAGGWYRLASHSPKNIYPERLGHYFVWRDETKNWNALFRAEQGRWRAELLDNPLEARLDQEPSMPMPSRGSTGDSGVGEPRVNQERGAHGVNREILDFTSEAGRISAVKGYVDFWAAQTG